MRRLSRLFIGIVAGLLPLIAGAAVIQLTSPDTESITAGAGVFRGELFTIETTTSINIVETRVSTSSNFFGGAWATDYSVAFYNASGSDQAWFSRYTVDGNLGYIQFKRCTDSNCTAFTDDDLVVSAGTTFAINFNGGTLTDWTAYGTNNNTYPSGTAISAFSGGAWQVGATTLADLYFALYAKSEAQGLYGNLTDTVSITDPASSSTVSRSFGVATIFYTLASSTHTGTLQGSISYGYTSSTLNYVDSFAMETAAGGHTAGVALTQPLLGPDLYLRAQTFDVWSTSTQVLATSSLIHIFLTETPSSTLQSTSSTLNITGACSRVAGFAQGFCNTIGSAVRTIQRKPPFGYILLLKDELLTLSTSTASSSYSFPDFTTTGIYTNFFSYIRTGLIVLFWLAFLFGISKQFIHARY